MYTYSLKSFCLHKKQTVPNFTEINVQKEVCKQRASRQRKIHYDFKITADASNVPNSSAKMSCYSLLMNYLVVVLVESPWWLPLAFAPKFWEVVGTYEC